MKKIDNRIEILRESPVSDYVFGHMNKESQANFEVILAEDTQLQYMVNAERVFRDKLLAFKRNHLTMVWLPVIAEEKSYSMSNIS